MPTIKQAATNWRQEARSSPSAEPGPAHPRPGGHHHGVHRLPGGRPARRRRRRGGHLPCYLLTIIPAPWFRRHGKHPAVAAFVDGVTAGAIGAIAGAVIVLGRRSIIDLPTILIAAATLLALVKLGRRAPEPLLVAAAGLVGLAIGH